MLIKKNTPYMYDDNIHILFKRVKTTHNYLYFFAYTEPYIDDYVYYWISDNNYMVSIKDKMQPIDPIDEVLYNDTIQGMKDYISSNNIKDIKLPDFMWFF